MGIPKWSQINHNTHYCPHRYPFIHLFGEKQVEKRDLPKVTTGTPQPDSNPRHYVCQSRTLTIRPCASKLVGNCGVHILIISRILTKFVSIRKTHIIVRSTFWQAGLCRHIEATRHRHRQISTRPDFVIWLIAC